MAAGMTVSGGGSEPGARGPAVASHRSDNRMVAGRYQGMVPFRRVACRALPLAAVLSCLLPLAARAGASGEAAPSAEEKPPAAATVVEMATSMGSITVELDPEKAPVTVANFLQYVAAGHYDGTVFHRVVGGYIIQGGGFEKKGDRLVEKPTGEPIRNEADNGLKNVEGTIAMARTDAPDTATAQFFLNCRDNEMLDHSPASAGYAVFGRVIKGLDVVKQINGVQTGVREVQGLLGNGQLRPMPLKSVPLSDVVIESVRVLAGGQGGSGPAESGTAEKPAGGEEGAARK